MLACLDVDYRVAGPAVAACVVFREWSASEPAAETVVVLASVADYEPGRFYKRELPCLLAVLAKVTDPLEAIVIDGNVWLDGSEAPGLGAHLHRALGGVTPIIGVAKSRFGEGDGCEPVLRGASENPLYVSAVGVELAIAKAHLAAMAGEFRLPTLLKRVDRLCRDHVL